MVVNSYSGALKRTRSQFSAYFYNLERTKERLTYAKHYSEARTGIPHFNVLLLYCTSDTFFFFLKKQMGGLWEPWIKQVSQCHFSNSISSFHISVLHFGNSWDISSCFHFLFWWSVCDLWVICDLWCSHCHCFGAPWIVPISDEELSPQPVSFSSSLPIPWDTVWY